MKEMKFNTNIKCTGCIEKVTPLLNEVEGINEWEVDILSIDKVLRVKSGSVSPAEVISAVKKAGYEITQVE